MRDYTSVRLAFSAKTEHFRFQTEKHNSEGREKYLQTASDSQIKENMDGQESDNPKQSMADMTGYRYLFAYVWFGLSGNSFEKQVQNLIQQMQARFQAMSDSIVSKIDEMGCRVEELEKSINELRAEMGAEGSPSPLAPSKSKPEEVKPDD